MLNKDEIIKRLKPFMEGRPEILFSYLYGSFAKGTQNRLSDVDIAVYLDDRAVPPKDFFTYRVGLITDLMSLLRKEDVEAILLNQAKPLLAHQVLKHGVLLTSRDEMSKNFFAVKTFQRYIDFKFMMVPHYESLSKRLKQGTFGGR